MISPLASALDHLQIVPLKSTGGKHHAVVEDRRRDGVHGQARAFPHNGPGLEVIASEAILTGNDDLCASRVFHHERRGPGIDLRAINAP